MDPNNTQLPIFLIRRVASRLRALMLNFNTVERDVLYVILVTSQDELCAAVEFYTNEVSPHRRNNSIVAPPVLQTHPFYPNATFHHQIQHFPEQAQAHAQALAPQGPQVYQPPCQGPSNTHSTQ